VAGCGPRESSQPSGWVRAAREVTAARSAPIHAPARSSSGPAHGPCARGAPASAYGTAAACSGSPSAQAPDIHASAAGAVCTPDRRMRARTPHAHPQQRHKPRHLLGPRLGRPPRAVAGEEVDVGRHIALRVWQLMQRGRAMRGHAVLVGRLGRQPAPHVSERCCGGGRAPGCVRAAHRGRGACGEPAGRRPHGGAHSSGCTAGRCRAACCAHHPAAAQQQEQRMACDIASHLTLWLGPRKWAGVPAVGPVPLPAESWLARLSAAPDLLHDPSSRIARCREAVGLVTGAAAAASPSPMPDRSLRRLGWPVPRNQAPGPPQERRGTVTSSQVARGLPTAAARGGGGGGGAPRGRPPAGRHRVFST
jgi:hypothetical protein